MPVHMTDINNTNRTIKPTYIPDHHSTSGIQTVIKNERKKTENARAERWLDGNTVIKFLH